MPFIDDTDGLRKFLIAHPDTAIKPGDRCFLFYAKMMDMWNEEKRWTTASKVYDWVKEQEPVKEDQHAKELAWQVFFFIHVMEYERQKRAENGDIHGTK